MQVHYFPTRDILASPAANIVIPVNCVGVMGKGLALQFRNQHFSQYKVYRAFCMAGQVNPGNPFSLIADNGINWIMFPTKQDWRNPSELAWINAGCIELAAQAHTYGWQNIALPGLGCGLGGLSWREVHGVILAAFQGLELDLLIYGQSQPEIY